MKITIQQEISEALYAEALELIHRAFDEHLKNGIEFTCSRFTLDDLKNKTKDGYITTATDEDGRTVGFSFLSLNGSSAYREFVAVSPEHKRQGIGTEMLTEEIKFLTNKRGDSVTHILTDTSVHATSSIKWHKKNKFRIIGLASYGSTDYYSYLFRRQLTSPSLWNSQFWCSCMYLFSWIFCKSTRNRNGTLTALGKTLKTIKNIIHK